MNCVDRIEADSIMIEVVDKHTGKIYRRNLPVKYSETANGVVLSGETMDGAPVELAFYSADALRRIQELFGRGPDVPRCGTTGG